MNNGEVSKAVQPVVVKVTLDEEKASSIPRGFENSEKCAQRISYFGSTFGKKPTQQNHLVPPKNLHSRSAENLKHHQKTDSADDAESFQNVYLDVNGYKTFFAVCDESPYSSTEIRPNEPVYTWEYDGETLRALSKVTKKFDSFRMRQFRAKCFSGGGDLDAGRSEKGKKHKMDGSSFAESKDLNDFNRVSCTANKLFQEEQSVLRDTFDVDDHAARIQNQSLLLSQEEKERIEFFYSSLGCETFVAGCMVDVLASVRANSSVFQDSSGPSPYRWVQVWVGVPVLAFNLGSDIKPRSLTIVVAQRDTGMTLWAERVTYATDYRQVENDGLHFLNESGSGRRALKIRWSDWDCARAFIEKFKTLTSDRNDPMWTKNSAQPSIDPNSNKKHSKKLFKKRDVKKYKPESNNAIADCKALTSVKRDPSCRNPPTSDASRQITKENISLPFNLRVMTRVDSKDINFRSTFAGLLPMPHNKKSVCAMIKSEDFRPRLPTN